MGNYDGPSKRATPAAYSFLHHSLKEVCTLIIHAMCTVTVRAQLCTFPTEPTQITS